MQYEDTVTISTPEGIELEYALAGLASRFMAEAADVALRVVVFAALFGLVAATGRSSWELVLLAIVAFLEIFAYDVAFEVWAGGRTPGKRLAGLRVMMAKGQPVGFSASVVRNLVRIIDEWATVFLAGIISILVSAHNQRLGDHAAGTIVVRERRAQVNRTDLPSGAQRTPGLDATAVTPAELAAIRDFLSRRDSLSDDARRRVALKLAESLEAKVGGLAPGGQGAEQLLEMIAAGRLDSS
jgi:uncharacterized RDD family membrane protein YckC